MILENTQEFAALMEEWEDLYYDCPFATPFQSWAWLYSWWESYGEYYELRLVTVRNSGHLVGLLPLMLERRGGLGRLLFVGTGLTDYLDMLVRKGWESRVSEVGKRALEQMDGWHVADFQQLRPEAAAWSIFEGWARLRTYVRQDNFPIIDVKPWDELVGSLSKNHRSTARRTLRRAEADGVRCELTSLHDAEQAAQRLVTLHREAWRGRGIAPEHLTRRFESHLQATAGRMIASGLGGISEFRRDRAVVASSFLVFGRDFVGTYLQGASMEALRRYQFNSLYIWNAVNIAYSKSSSRLDLLRGDEPYKLRWNPTIVPSYRMILGRSSVFFAPYARYHVLYSKAREYVRSESAPQWAKSARHVYRNLRQVGLRNLNIGKRS